jgi:hypothetical protein
MVSARAVLAGLCVVVAGAAANADESAPGTWSLAKEREGTRVMSRDIPGSEIVEVRGITRLPFPPDVVMAVLGDVDRYPEIMPPTSVTRQLRRQGLAVDYYMVLDPPVISRRDGCTHIEYSRRGPAFHVTWRPATGCPAADDDTVRMAANRGTWDIGPTADGGTSVVYQGHADPGGSLPDWMINRAVIDGCLDTLDALRAAASDARYQRCAGHLQSCLPWLGEPVAGP